MIIRSPNLFLDGIYCALQGAVGVGIFNAIRGSKVVSPLNGALCLGGIAVAEKLFYKLTQKFIPGPTAFLGPIPIGPKNIVSYGLSMCSVVQVMQITGLITSIPRLVQLTGLGCSWALFVGGAKAAIDYYYRPLDQQLQEHRDSKTFANQVFTFDHEGKKLRVRIICNPENKVVCFRLEGLGKFVSEDSYILVCNETIPEAVNERIENFFGGQLSSVVGPANGAFTLIPHVSEK